MALSQLPCIAIESSHVGEVRWFINANTCQQKYDALIADPAYDRSTITRFELTVDDELDPESITRIADQAMWCTDYVPLQRRHGAAKIFAAAEQPRNTRLDASV